MALQPVNRKVQIRSRQKVVGLVREHYLRPSLPCQAELCFEACEREGASAPGLPRLPAGVSHYLLPLADVASEFLDVLAAPELSGLILLQTVVNRVSAQNLGRYRRLCALIRDPAKGAIFWPNEFGQATYWARDPATRSAEMHRAELAFRAARWFYEHLGGQRPIVLVTEEPEVVRHWQGRRLEVFVLHLGDYLRDFWPDLLAAHETYAGIMAARSDPPEATRGECAEYLKLSVLEAGLRHGQFVAGQLVVDKHHAASEALVHRSGDGTKSERRDILIPGMVLRNRAVHGDLVAVQLLPKSQWRSKLTGLGSGSANQDREETWERRADVEPTGRVVGILARRWREYIATIPQGEARSLRRRSGQRVLAIPYDYRVPRIRILTSQGHRLVHQRIVVRIDNWPTHSQYPNGHFVRALGPIGDLETEIDGILMENEVSVTPFSQGILAEMPPPDWSPGPDDLARRKDLRISHLVMSIDPQGCQDVDDTLSVRKLTNGHLELGVHIADVNHFVPCDSLTDLEARRRATTVYLADRRYDMLPSVLSAQVCSLLGGVDRLAVSVLWEIHPQTYEVISVWYGRTVIKSAYQMAYESAQAILNGQSAEAMQSELPELAAFRGQGLQKKFKTLRDSLRLLNTIAQAIQTKRETNGALRLESTEVQFEFEKASLEDIKPKEHLKIHETVAECMILANHWVAKKIAKSFPHQSLLRRHPPPKAENFEELQRCAASKGWNIDVWCNKVLAESLNQCQDPKDPMVNFLLRNLATQAMVQAVYFSTGSTNPEDWEHYGLALGQYTHFTSPIRRYADIIVHRLLFAALENQDWWTDLEAKDNQANLLANIELQEVATHINERNRAAQRAQRSSQSLFQTLYFKGKDVDDPRCIVEAIIVSLKPNGFIVYIPRYALKGPVYMQNAEEEVLFCDQKLGPMWVSGTMRKEDQAFHVESVEGDQVYRLFDHVTVTIQMKGSDVHPWVLKYYLLSPKPPRNGEKLQLGQGEVNFLREIRKEEEELVMDQGDEDDGESVALTDEAVNEAEGGLSNGSSSKKSKRSKREKQTMYEFFQKMRLIAITNNELG